MRKRKTLLYTAVCLFASVFAFTACGKKPVETNPPTENVPQESNVLHDGELSAYFVNVGQGDCEIIVFPDGKSMIIDAGSTAGGSVNTVTTTLDALGITRLDYVLLTHADSDHCSYLDDAVKHVEQVYRAYVPKIKSSGYDLGLSSEYKTKTTVVYNNFIDAVSNSKYVDSGTEVNTEICFTCGEIVIEGDGYRITMYCRSDEYYTSMKINDALDINDVSPIVVIEYNGKKLVFAGDSNSSENHSEANGSAEKAFLDIMSAKGVSDADFDADVLKVPHHGSSGACGADFLDFIDVEYGIVSVGGNANDTLDAYNLYISNELTNEQTHYPIQANKSYGHPTPEVCSESGRLKAAGLKQVYYTWFNGTVSCKVDKDGNLTFSAEKEAKKEEDVIVFSAVILSTDNVVNVYMLQALPTKKYC